MICELPDGSEFEMPANAVKAFAEWRKHPGFRHLSDDEVFEFMMFRILATWDGQIQ
jgi:hypothetical protein